MDVPLVLNEFGIDSRSRLKDDYCTREYKSGLTQPDGLVALKTCMVTHAPALSVREMDVFQDAVWLRCAECRAQFDLAVSQFETHQK